MLSCPAACPREFREDVVAVARKGEIPVTQVAKNFGITESCLRRWLAQGSIKLAADPLV